MCLGRGDVILNRILAHAGRKGSAQRPWKGGGPLTQADAPDLPWTTFSASSLPYDPAAKWHTPVALDAAGLRRVKQSFVTAVERSARLGFDLVEVHGAHGYLLAQFLSAESNFRDDAYGGSLQNRARLCLEVLDAVIDEWDAGHVGIRISPLGVFNGLSETDQQEMALYLIGEIAKRNIAFLHLSEPDWAGGPAWPDEFRRAVRAIYPHPIIAAGGYVSVNCGGAPDGNTIPIPKDVAEAAMRASVATKQLDDVLSGAGRADIEGSVMTRMQAILDAYQSGIAVQGVQIRKTDPPKEVEEAFKDVSAAQQDADAEINKAELYAQQVLARAQGDAASFDKIYAEYRLAPEVTRRRLYYETMERVLRNTDKTVIEAPGVTPYLPLQEVRRRPAPNTPAGTQAGEGAQ